MIDDLSDGISNGNPWLCTWGTATQESTMMY